MLTGFAGYSGNRGVRVGESSGDTVGCRVMGDQGEGWGRGLCMPKEGFGVVSS